jgi:hypothetical protein
MNLSSCSLYLLFVLFLAYFEIASWPAFPRMSDKAVSKSDKKGIQNQRLNTGIAS